MQSTGIFSSQSAAPSKRQSRIPAQRYRCPDVASQRCSRTKRCLAAHAAGNMIGVHALVYAGALAIASLLQEAHHQGDWTEESCIKAVRGAKDAGYGLIEVPLLDPATVDTAMTRAVLEEHGMAATTSLGLSLDADINSEDAEVVKRGHELLDAALVSTHAINASHMVGVIYSALHKYPGPCSPAARKNVVKSLQLLADKAMDLGVELGLEAVNRYETNVMNTASEAMDLLDAVNRRNVKVHLDSYHMNIEENSMHEAVATCGESLGYVHIGESHRGYLGRGSVDFDGLFKALSSINYNGPITFESFSSAVVSKDISNTLCVWRNLWDDGDDLAVQAKQFIDAKLGAGSSGLSTGGAAEPTSRAGWQKRMAAYQDMSE